MITNFEEYRKNKAENTTIDYEAAMRYFRKLLAGEYVDWDGNPEKVDYSFTEEYDKKEYKKYLKTVMYKTENQRKIEEFIRTHTMTEEELEEIDETFWEECGIDE